MTEQFTQGEWGISYGFRAAYGAPVVVRDGVDCIAIPDSCGGRIGLQEMTANAHLMSASKDLYRACEAVNSKVDDEQLDITKRGGRLGVYFTYAELMAFRDAAKKARGEQ